MLSQHDRRELADIEEHLRSSEPELVQLLEGFHAWAPPRRRRSELHRAIGLAGFALGCALLLIAVVSHNADIVVLGVLALVADTALWLVLAGVALVRHHLARQESRGR